MPCERCGNKVVENADTNLCGSCGADDRKAERAAAKPKKVYHLPKPKAPIKKQSDKRALDEEIYLRKVRLWKVGKMCGVRGCDQKCQDCHHQKGRDGDLLLNEKYWFPTCRGHHIEITTDSAWAIREGYSLKRNSDGNTREDEVHER